MPDYRTDPDNPLPLYIQLYISLRERIVSGEFPPGSLLPPEMTLIEDYAVSRITVTKAMQKLEQEGLIKRQRGRGTFVLEKSLEETSRRLTIGYIPGTMINPYFYHIQMGIAEITTRENFQLNVIGPIELRDKDHAEKLDHIANGLDGLVIYPGPNKQDLSLLQKLTNQGLPVVMIDRYYEEVGCDSVVFEEENASYELTQLLIDRGHTRIAIVTHFEVNVSSIRNRIAGYVRCLKANNIFPSDELMWFDVYNQLRPAAKQQDEAMTTELLSLLRKHEPTAIVSVNQDVADRLTFDLMTINQYLNNPDPTANGQSQDQIKPEIVTFGLKLPEHYGPYTVAVAMQRGEGLGHNAAELLIRRLKEKQQGNPQHIALPVPIVERRNNISAEKEIIPNN